MIATVTYTAHECYLWVVLPPTCPDCHGQMVRTIIEHEDGSAAVAWLCACRPTEDDLMSLVARRTT